MWVGKVGMWKLRWVGAGGSEECNRYSVDLYIVKSALGGYGSLQEVM